MSKPCPATVKLVIKGLIPPKRVERKNSMEGFEPFGADEDECKPGESESENEEDLSSLTMTFLKIY